MVFVLLALAVIGLVRQKGNSARFDRIERGDSVAEVVSELGKPDEIRDCGEFLYWDGDHEPIGSNDGQCVLEYYYGSAPGGWSVGFNEDNKVVAKYAFVSP